MEDNDTSLGADDQKFDDPTNGDSKVAHRAESTARKTASMTSRAYGQMKKDIISGRLRPGQKLKIDELRQVGDHPGRCHSKSHRAHTYCLLRACYRRPSGSD